jgi:hypothetical protein
MLVRARGASGFTNSMLARLLGVTCHDPASPIATFSICSLSAKAIEAWTPAWPSITTTSSAT